MRFVFGFLACTVLATGIIHAQQIYVAPIPFWVKPVIFSELVGDSTGGSGGYYDLLSDDQYNLIDQQSFHHYAQLITSEKGLENVSSIIQNFDPSYQTITFHLLQVIRNSQKNNQLKKEKFEIIHREESLDRAIYDGDLTAVFHFNDLKVGDIVEYAFSYKGFNPAFNKFSRPFYFNYGVPVAKIFTRVVTPKDRAFTLHSFNNPPKEIITIKGNQKEYTWTAENVKALLYDDNYPGWYEPHDRVDFSEYNSWAEVAAWDTKLFSSAFISAPAIDRQIALFKKEKNLEESVNQCIRFVQDEVRYLSFSDGIHGFKPHPAAQIFSQRFGDCKDKSVLLTLMLRNLGLKSNPVLVHSSTGKLLSEGLPSPGKFNHCIVQFQLNDSTYWIDPTMSLQRGPLNARFTPNYAFGLVLNTETETLSSIPYESKNSYIAVKEKFNVAKVGTSATLSVDTEYGGDEANSIRDYFRSNSADEATKSYLNFYATDYPKIIAERNVWVDDNEVENIFTSHEKYFISSFWGYDSTYGKYSVNIYPRTLANYFPKSNTKIRAMPYNLIYPRSVHYEIVLKMPESWTAGKSSKSIETAGFQYKSSMGYADSVISLKYFLKIKKSFLEVGEIGEHLQKVDEAINDLSTDLTYTNNKPTVNKFNAPFAIILIGLSAFLYFGLRKCYEYDPEPKPSATKFDAIGGWLFLVAIGLCFAPLRTLYFIYTTDFFQYNNWRMLADATYSAYNPTLGLIVLLELMINCALCAYGFLVAVLFFKRRTNVPGLASAFYAANLLFLIGDTLIGENLNLGGFDKEATKNLVQNLFVCAIWIPYFNISNRSKGTFTVRR